MEMEQYDCPFIDTTADHDVSFSTFQWEFDTSNRELETRMVVEGSDRSGLDAGLAALRDHPHMAEYTLIRQWDDVAHIYTAIDETDAMQTIRANDGYISGPFYIESGTEQWHVGFDSRVRADITLSELERNNEFTVVSRRQDGFSDVGDVVAALDSARQLVESCRGLTDVEERTLIAAVEGGYFQSPRETTLGDLAEQFDISKPALSKNLRRGQQKVLEGVVGVLSESDPE